MTDHYVPGPNAHIDTTEFEREIGELAGDSTGIDLMKLELAPSIYEAMERRIAVDPDEPSPTAILCRYPGARFLHRALDFVPRAQLESLFHGGLVDGESGVIKKPQWWRWPLAVLAGLYLPLAGLGAAAFSILIAATSLNPVWKVALVLMVVAGLLGHAMHAFLILIQPLWIERKCRRRNIVERIMARSW